MIMPNAIGQIERNISEDNTINNKRYLYKFKKKKGNDIKDKLIKEIRFLFESDEDYYEPMRSGNTFSSNYIEYGSNAD